MNLMLIRVKLVVVVKNIVCKILKYKRWEIQIYMNKRSVYGKAKTIQDSYSLRTLSVLSLPISVIIWAAPLQWPKERQEKSEIAVWRHLDLLPCSSFYLNANKLPSPEGRDRKIGRLILYIDSRARTIPPCFMTMTRKQYPASFVLQKIRQDEIMTRYCLNDSLFKSRNSRFFLIPCIILNQEDSEDI